MITADVASLSKALYSGPLHWDCPYALSEKQAFSFQKGFYLEMFQIEPVMVPREAQPNNTRVLKSL